MNSMQDLHDELVFGLRTPLTSVLGYAQTLLDRWDLLEPEEQIRFIRIVYSEALRMSHSVEQVDRHLYRDLAVDRACTGEFKHEESLADAS